jgi:hypothetical protein
MHFIGRNPADKGVVACLPAELDGQLLVTDDERAILFESGATLVDLGPGRHRLTPAEIPSLHVAGDLSGVRIFLVRTVPVPVPLRGATSPVPVDGYHVLARVELEGSCQVQVTDPRRLLASLTATGSEVGPALAEATTRAVKQALTQALTRALAPLPEICADPPAALLEEVRARAADALAPHGVTATAIVLTLRLDDEARLQLAKTMPPGSSGADPAVAPPAEVAAPAAPAAAAAHPATLSAGRCSTCGAAVADRARFCSGCGKPVTVGPRRCATCGGELAANARFCSGCGTRL